jgi:hypothetical protein
MTVWATLAVLAGGLFAGGAMTIAWSRVPIWRKMPAPQFVSDFSGTIRLADKVQPPLLLAAIVSAAAFAFTAGSTAGLLAMMAAGGFLATLIASVVVLVPLQRRIMAAPPQRSEAIEEMRLRWFRGHLGRSALSLVSFAFIAVASAV